jgi:hypothetical protein
VNGNEIPLRLTAKQVMELIAAVAAEAASAELLAGLARPRELANSPLLEDTRVSRSLLYGLVALVSFPADGSERGLMEVASELGLPGSTTYRYVHTLRAIGLLAQDPVTRKYRRVQPLGGVCGSGK